MTSERRLPGEDATLPMRLGGAPISDLEALGVARRLARIQTERGRKLTSLAETAVLPAEDATAIPVAFRLPPALMMRVRAKAEMEGITVTSVIEDALKGYAASSPGAVVAWDAPPRDGAVSVIAGEAIEHRQDGAYLRRRAAARRRFEHLKAEQAEAGNKES